MPPFLLQHEFYRLISNIAVALGMISASAALSVAIVRKTAQMFRTLSFLLIGLFVFAALGRLVRAFGIDGYFAALLDGVTGIFAIAVGILIWPILKKSLGLPTYEQISLSFAEKAEAYKLLESQQRLFETFMDNSPTLAFLEDEEGHFVLVNDAFEKQLGVKKADLVGQRNVLWSSPEEAKVVNEHFQEVLSQRVPITRVSHFPSTPGGEPEPWLVVRFPIPANPEKAVIGGMAMNIKSEMKLGELNSKLATIVESSQDAIIGKDLDGNITSWNKGAEMLYEYSPSEAIGRNLSMLIPPDYINELPEILDKIRRGVPVPDYKTVRITKRGDIKDIMESISPITDVDGAVKGAAVIARDITVLKKQQHEIEKLNEQLKNRVYELAESNAALQTARDQALEASSLKSAFVANISHELRTPLSGILGLNEVLLQNGSLNKEDATLAQMVQQSAEALLNVVNDILDLSKIEAGKIVLEYEPFNPVFLLQDCTRLMSPTAHQKNLNYELLIDQRIPELVYGDATRLRQILLNIIGNAIKFTDKGSVKVSARVKKISEDATELEFGVADTGIGMEPDEQRFLFMPFAQANNTSTRRFGGTGLGLSISKRFVEMMHGEIQVKSKKDVGSLFTVIISFDRKRMHEAEEFGTDKMFRPSVEPIPSALASGRRVLVVEDNSILQQLALRQLSNLGVKAESTVLGRDAIELAMSGRFDIVLMDVNLPDISGLEATATIRSLEHSAGRDAIPIIAMTAGAMKGDRERAIAAGMNDYLAKPVAIELLKRVLELWLARVKTRQPST
jgi:PAS domain S-box-containing protein